MSRNEDIDNAIWADPDFEALSPYAALLFLWSWTNPRCDMAGIYKVSQRAMTESKVPAEEIPAALAELAAAKFAFYEDAVLWVRARAKRLRSRSPHMAKSVAKDLQKVDPAHPLRRRFVETYAQDPWLREALADAAAGTRGGENGTLSGTYADPMGNLSENPLGKGDLHTLSIPSPEGPGTRDKGQGQVKGQGSNDSTKEVTLPEDFPEELRPHLKATFRILRSLAERHGAKAINVMSLANVVMARPQKPLVRCAHDCAAHWDGKAQRVKDVVAAYRNWLDRADDLAATEVLTHGGGGRVVAMERPAALRLADRWQAGYGDGAS